MEKEMRNRYFSAVISDLKCSYDFVMDGAITPEQNVDDNSKKGKKDEIKYPKTKENDEK